MTDLRPCPFCGGKAEIDKWYSAKTGLYYASIKCQSCFSKSKQVKMEEEPDEWNLRGVVRGWNTRV